MEHESCRHLLSSLSDYIDGDLGVELCEAIDHHLQDCDNCRIVVDSLRKTVRLYRENSVEVEIPIEVRSRLYTRLDLIEFINRK